MRSTKGFTIAEIAVAATVVAVLSGMAVLSARVFSERAATESLRTKIVSELSSLDRSVRDRSVSSYRAEFSSGSIGYVSVSDGHSATASGSVLSYDWSSASGQFRVSAPYSGPWTIRLAEDNKIVGTVSLSSASATVPFSFSTGKKDAYSAAFFFDSEPENRIAFVHFDRDSVLAPEESKLVLRSVSSSGTEYASLVVENVLDSKTLLADGVPVESALLTFSRGAKEYSIEIRK